MKRFVFICILLFPLNAFASPDEQVVIINQNVAAEQSVLAELPKLEDLAINIRTEYRTAIAHAQKLPPELQNFALYFTSYAIPDDIKVRLTNLSVGPDALQEISLQDASAYTLNFWIHSLSNSQIFHPPTRLTKTLYYVDIRHYGWTREACERVSALDPYVREPYVAHEDAKLLRILVGNALLRTDWFISHTSDVAKQVDVGSKPLYYELLYANTDIPKNIQDFRKAWAVDMTKIESIFTLKGTIIAKGASGISLNNRQLARTRTEVGYYWETADVINMTGGKNYVENLRPGLRQSEEIDAGEAITNNYLGLQVYFVFDKNWNRIEIADTGIVVDNTAGPDKRVRAARSCVACHGQGINPVGNALTALLDSGVELRFLIENRAIETERFYLSPLGELVKDDQIFYSRAVAACNNLNSIENSALFKKILRWEEEDVTLEQAAIECGVTIDVFKEKNKHTISGLLAGLVNGRPIPREIWAEEGGGLFAQAMINVYNINVPQIKKQGEEEYKKQTKQAIRDQKEKIEAREKLRTEEEISTKTFKTIKESRFMSGSTELDIIPSGKVFPLLKKNGNWYELEYNGEKGWINQTDVEVLEK